MEQNKRSGRDAKRSYWGDHIAGWKQSGLSQQAYCRKHQLSLSSFGYWRSRLKRGGDDQARFSPGNGRHRYSDNLTTTRAPRLRPGGHTR
ncbi:MAG: hypothetical protein JKP90_07835 [Desulfofustis sp. PB-SRB1]|nr:hypothetical protein [Desulfofustis sp. PB-SRB1]